MRAKRREEKESSKEEEVRTSSKTTSEARSLMACSKVEGEIVASKLRPKDAEHVTNSEGPIASPS